MPRNHLEYMSEEGPGFFGNGKEDLLIFLI